jgi:16S rRNA (guanine966-N2)-methyltransferase
MPKPSRRPNTPKNRSKPDTDRAVVGLRIIGGKFRGRQLRYSGDMRTRPMKDRLREAIFNLIGPGIRGSHAIDLFAGTGALGLEALSRGADRATLIEQHHPTAGLIRQNAAELGVAERADVAIGNVFIWWDRQRKERQNISTHPSGAEALSDKPWAVFCSPPYAFYVDRTTEMLEMVGGMIDAAPSGSVFVVEADSRFDFEQLPDPQSWDVRAYSPAVVGIFRKT